MGTTLKTQQFGCLTAGSRKLVKAHEKQTGISNFLPCLSLDHRPCHQGELLLLDLSHLDTHKDKSWDMNFAVQHGRAQQVGSGLPLTILACVRGNL